MLTDRGVIEAKASASMRTECVIDDTSQFESVKTLIKTFRTAGYLSGPLQEKCSIPQQ